MEEEEEEAAEEEAAPRGEQPAAQQAGSLEAAAVRDCQGSLQALVTSCGSFAKARP